MSTFITAVDRANRVIVVARGIQGAASRLIVITGQGEQLETPLDEKERMALIEALGGQA